VRRWVVTFEAGDGRLVTTSLTTAPGGRKETLDAFSAMMRRALTHDGCQGFSITVHQDGADCDHETGGTRGNAA
jgi:hypothetical protein